MHRYIQKILDVNFIINIDFEACNIINDIITKLIYKLLKIYGSRDTLTGRNITGKSISIESSILILIGGETGKSIIAEFNNALVNFDCYSKFHTWNKTRNEYAKLSFSTLVIEKIISEYTNEFISDSFVVGVTAVVEHFIFLLLVISARHSIGNLILSQNVINSILNDDEMSEIIENIYETSNWVLKLHTEFTPFLLNRECLILGDNRTHLTRYQEIERLEYEDTNTTL